MKQKEHIWWGIYFLIIQGIIMFFNRNTVNTDVFLWFCNHSPLLFAIGFFLGRREMGKALVIIGLVPQILWFMDFTVRLLLGTSVFGFTEYIFSRNLLGFVIGAVIHLCTTFVVCVLLIRDRVRYKTLMYACCYLLLIWSITLFFGTQATNPNCIFLLCGIPSLTPPLYTQAWILYTFSIMVLPVSLVLDWIALKTQKEEMPHQDFWNRPLLKK